MAFKRYANALTSDRNIHFDRWMEELRTQASDAIPEKRVIKTAKEVLTRCDPKQYLLSHATIVASVDTYTPKNAKAGRGFDERGLEIDVRFSDYRIKPECLEIINNNGDAWERSLLMSTYKTFVGAPNYLEHIQLPALSKGFIVDAIARDIGNSCYIDILVATDRKHNQLVNDIMAGEMQAMSMGCISLFTICSRCGNVAADDAQLCSHVLYDGKLTDYIEDGITHKLGELIGHVTVPNSNQFIEASWVRNPAFKGAVRRNLLNADHIANNTQFAAQFDTSAHVAEFRNGLEFDVPSRAASVKVQVPRFLPSLLKIAEEMADDPDSDDSDSELSLDDLGSDSGSDSGDLDIGKDDSDSGSDDIGESIESPKDSKKKIQELADKIKEQVLELVINDLGESLQPDADDVGTAAPPTSVNALNDNILSTQNYNRLLRRHFNKHDDLIRWASTIYGSIYRNRDDRSKRFHILSSLSPQDLIKFSWINDVVSSRSYPAELYQAVMAVGPAKGYPSRKSFLAACSIHLNRSTNEAEKKFLFRKGRIASLSNKF